MKLKKLDWDSQFFNLEVAELNLEQELILHEFFLDFDLLYVKQEKEFEFVIPNFEKTFLETKIVFNKKIESNNDIHEDENVFSLKKVNYSISNIYDLAYESGKFSRFKLDTNFKETDFKSLYKTWVDNSLNGLIADEVFVYLLNDVIYGFVTFKKGNDFASIGLIAVSPDSQSKGVGTALLLAVEQSLVTSGIFELRIPTQYQNEVACKFYSKMGYQIVDKTIIKHYWKILN
jgi:dTDP-4-amino-4,6-dideoxy-D-galactose acyltransferase